MSNVTTFCGFLWTKGETMYCHFAHYALHSFSFLSVSVFVFSSPAEATTEKKQRGAGQPGDHAS